MQFVTVIVTFAPNAVFYGCKCMSLMCDNKQWRNIMSGLSLLTSTLSPVHAPNAKL